MSTHTLRNPLLRHHSYIRLSVSRSEPIALYRAPDSDASWLLGACLLVFGYMIHSIGIAALL